MEYISLECLALRVGLPQSYLRGLIREGRLPHLVVGGRKRFNESSVCEVLHKIEQEASKVPTLLSDMQLSVRADNCLSGMGITTAEEFLRQIPHFGPTSLREVQRKLCALGLTLAK